MQLCVYGRSLGVSISTWPLGPAWPLSLTSEKYLLCTQGQFKIGAGRFQVGLTHTREA